MKKSLPLFLCLIFALNLPAQNFSGQWKGQFTDRSTSFVGWGGDRCDYVIELDCKGRIVSGYSYTYFNEGGKRYYTICRLKGTFDKATKFIEVTETERTKTNVPNNIRNCFQVHRLNYSQQGEDQTLEGTWVPAPNQQGDCGYGVTNLTRRVLQKNPALFNNPLVKNEKPVKKTTVKPAENTKEKSNTVSAIKPIQKNTNTPPPILKNNPEIEQGKIKNIEPLVIRPDIQPKLTTENSYEKRSTTLLKTIEIENLSFRVDLYDNGDIDGDSISLFFNGKLLLQHQRLSDKAISITLRADTRQDLNELVMYAENLGEIPPNTALMVVTDGENRYEVRISSDLEKSGVIRFVYKPKNGQ